MKRVGIFSGTFDPFHIAHLEACLVAKSACELDIVAVLIEKKPRRKAHVTAYEKRLVMVEYALQEYPGIRLLESPGDNVTIDNTLPILHEQFDAAEYWYIVGSDIISHLSKWQNIDRLFESLHLCVVLRSNEDAKKTEQELVTLKKKYPKLDYKIIPEVWSPLSSSAVRSEISEKGHSQSVHREVMKYIAKNNIY